MRVTIVILAAGFSRRLGHPKQLVMWNGETLLHRAARIAREVCDDVVVVTRPSVIPSVVEGPGGAGGAPHSHPGPSTTLGMTGGVRVVINDNAEEGIASSIRLGVAACDDAVLLMLCDQPHVTASHLRALIDANAPLVATRYAGVAGVPALFGAQYRDALLALRGDKGAQSLLGGAVVVACEEAAVDVDEGDQKP